VFESDDCLLEELRTVGRTRFVQARVGLSSQVHVGVFEIFLLERGEAQWWVEDEFHEIEAGDVYIVRPGERHGSVGPSLRPSGYSWLQLAVPKGAFPGMSLEETERIVGALSDRRVRSFSAPPEALEHLIEVWRCHAVPGSHSALRARARLHLLLAALVDRIETQANTEHRVSFAIRKVLRMVDADPSLSHPIEALAKVAGLGLTQFNVRFLAETGFTPGAYVRRRRIEKAKTRLGDQVSISALALELGFRSSQHFATVFKKLEGLQPTEFRAQHF
jgi:AraC-like DNA-binding protein